MTPLGCPDCLLIRYEPRALRAFARAPSHSHFLAKLVSLDFLLLRFLELFLFFFLEYTMHAIRECQIDGVRLGNP